MPNKRGYPRYIKHGCHEKRIYSVWEGIKARCCNKNSWAYKNYGARGILLHSEWQSFEGFRDWAYSNGYEDTLTIDRIDNDGNYEPSNCHFITQKENSRKRRNTKLTMCKANLIRDLCADAILSRGKIAELFGIAKCTVSDVTTNRRWV